MSDSRAVGRGAWGESPRAHLVRKLDVQKERVARLCPLKRRMDKLRGTSRLDEAEHVEVVEVVKFV